MISNYVLLYGNPIIGKTPQNMQQTLQSSSTYIYCLQTKEMLILDIIGGMYLIYQEDIW